MDYLHIDFEQPTDLVFNRPRLRRAFSRIGKAHVNEARRLLKRRQGTPSKAGRVPALQSGKLADSIAYRVPRASARRPGLMVKIAPSRKDTYTKYHWSRGATPLEGAYYPIFLHHGVRHATYGMSDKARRQRQHHKTGQWRLSPRRNYMADSMKTLSTWTKSTLFHALKRALQPKPLKKG